MTTIAFIGAGSTVFTRNLAGDILHRPALRGATLRLMDIDPKRLAESEVVVGKLAHALGGTARVETFTDRRRALDGADFVVVSFQIGGYEPATVVDFEVPKRFGLRQTIADTLGGGGHHARPANRPASLGALRGHGGGLPRRDPAPIRQPHGDQHLAISERFSAIRQVGLCHSVQGTAGELARDLGIPLERIRYRAGGINHMSFFLRFEEALPDGTHRDLYPALKQATARAACRAPRTRAPAAPIGCATRR
jgi:alpha-galactosidase